MSMHNNELHSNITPTPNTIFTADWNIVNVYVTAKYIVPNIWMWKLHDCMNTIEEQQSA